MHYFLVKKGIQLFLEQWDFLKNHWKWIVGFALMYAVFVVVCTFLFRFQKAIELEQQLYDSIQKEQTIDHDKDTFYKVYQKELEKLVFINFDTTVIDHETDRLKPNELAVFLQKISPYNSQIKALFIDYAARDLKMEDNRNLVKAMQPFGERLILPYVFYLKEPLKGTKDRIDVEDFKGAVEYPMYKGGSVGYVTTFKSPISDDYRLYKYRTDDDQHYSIPYKLCELTHGKETVEQHIQSFDNSIVEINFILRNRDVENKVRAVLSYDLSDFTNGKISEAETKKLLENKIVCIGLFGEYTNKYGQHPDKFITAVDNEMSGALLLVNAYLNLATKSYLQKGSCLWLFLINLMIGVLFGWYYTHREKGDFNLLQGVLIFFIINPFLTYMLYFILYYMIAGGIYLSLGMTLFIMLQSVFVYLLYSWLTKQCYIFPFLKK